MPRHSNATVIEPDVEDEIEEVEELDPDEEPEAEGREVRRPSYADRDGRKQFAADGGYEDPIDESNFTAEGKILGVGKDYNPKIHKAPKRSSFADETTYYEWRAQELEEEASKLASKATKYRETAVTLREIGDPEQRRKVRMAQSKVEAARKWLETLKDEGIDASILARMGIDLSALTAKK